MSQLGAAGELEVRWRFRLTGAVQGVGFRPFVYRLAQTLGLAGWVSNTAQGLVVELEGPQAAIAAFRSRLLSEAPAVARIDAVSIEAIQPQGTTGFVIRQSAEGGPRSVSVLPDLATCPGCLADIRDPANRRHRYPFTNCTHCGPRLSIIRALPYDRAATTMQGFTLCSACRAEYEDPADRRFHAQPNACPECGPQLALWDARGRELARSEAALGEAVARLCAGEILAVKGLGGFHLLADACNEDAVAALRQRKHRPAKPLAVMYPDLEQLERDCRVSPAAKALLGSPAAPVVLLPRRPEAGLAVGIAPGNPRVGAMLPYTPLHYLLLGDFGRPVVSTSGNLADEPICIDEHEALDRLRGIADAFLVHNRPIARQVDDSVVQLIGERPMPLRVARGYAPVSLPLGQPPPAVLATGGHLKNTLAVTSGENLIVSQHLGDLETPEACAAFERMADSLEALYDARPCLIACDHHPDYFTSRYARDSGRPVHPVQHHHAHIAAVMLEHGLRGPLLGMAWDGAGLGEDATVWGGEFLRCEGADCQRVAHLLPFPLPGGDAAAREARRSAAGLLFTLAGSDWAQASNPAVAAFTARERELLSQMLRRDVQTPLTTSMGRLFDGLAAVLGLHTGPGYEGQAAMALQFASEQGGDSTPYPLTITALEDGALGVDWRPMLRAVLADQAAGIAAADIARRCHATLVESVILVAQRLGLHQWVLAGGCFQNQLLVEMLQVKAGEAGAMVYWPQRLPPNDGALAAGQAAVVLARH
ncbi:carbamoyltransferase HypF [Aquisalimonas sp.]|uniref:carbamoyltransferase HypF n=1 Tax=Aquisalimonas sp. TaxID=1872621 RepID=UPI0025B95632|nr:carbamoyltransferase HypF [Aquisalimonas sp.]